MNLVQEQLAFSAVVIAMAPWCAGALSPQEHAAADAAPTRELFERCASLNLPSARYTLLRETLSCNWNDENGVDALLIARPLVELTDALEVDPSDASPRVLSLFEDLWSRARPESNQDTPPPAGQSPWTRASMRQALAYTPQARNLKTSLEGGTYLCERTEGTTRVSFQSQAKVVCLTRAIGSTQGSDLGQLLYPLPVGPAFQARLGANPWRELPAAAHLRLLCSNTMPFDKCSILAPAKLGATPLVVVYRKHDKAGSIHVFDTQRLAMDTQVPLGGIRVEWWLDRPGYAELVRWRIENFSREVSEADLRIKIPHGTSIASPDQRAPQFGGIAHSACKDATDIHFWPEDVVRAVEYEL